MSSTHRKLEHATALDSAYLSVLMVHVARVAITA